MRIITNEELLGVSGGVEVAPIDPSTIKAPDGMITVADLPGFGSGPAVFIVRFSDPAPAINPITGREMCPTGYEPTDMKFTDNVGTTTTNISWKDGKFTADLGGKAGEGTSSYSCKKP